VNDLLLKSINLGFDPTRTDIAGALVEALERSKNRIEGLNQSSIDPKSLADLQQRYEDEFQISLRDGTWIAKFRGRDILRRFAGEIVPGMSYEYFRDLIITRMSDSGYRPLGMSKIVQAILED
jgi:hypothetical protein